MASIGNVTGDDYDDLVTALAAGTASRTEFAPFVTALLASEQVTSGMVAFFNTLVADVEDAEE